MAVFTAISLSLVASISTYLIFKARDHYRDYHNEQRIAAIQKDFTRDEDSKYSKSDEYEMAVQAYREKDYQRAIKCIGAEVKKNPDHAQAYFLLGKVYEDVPFADGKYFVRMQHNYEKYIALKPEGIRTEYVKLKLAQYYLREGLKTKDDVLLGKAKEYLLSLDQANGMVKMGLGAVCLNYEQYEQAVTEFEQAVTLPDDELKLKYSSLGLAYIKTQNWNKAEKSLQLAVEIDPENKYVHYMLGFTYMQENKLKEAESSLKKALKLDPKYKYAKINLRRVQKALKEDKDRMSDKT